MKKLLMACSVYWDSPLQVGSHHLARAFLARGWEVGFISYPLTPLHLPFFHFPEIRARLRQCGRRIEHRAVGKLWSTVPFAFVAPANRALLRSRLVHRHWQQTAVPSIPTSLRRYGFDHVDLLYIDSPAQLSLLSAVQYDKAFYRLADHTSGFTFACPELLAMEREVATKVDLVAYTAHALEDYATTLGSRHTFLMPNGVDFSHFQTDDPVPPEYAAIGGPIVVYAGSLRYWFDYELVRSLAQRLPDINVVLIGPDDLAQKNLNDLPNIHLLGPRPYATLPAYLRHANVGIIPFAVETYPDLIHGVNPLKLYEYMATGLPVVTTAWRELEYLDSPARLTSSTDEFIASVAETIARPPDQNALRRFASTHDWSSRIDALEARLDMA